MSPVPPPTVPALLTDRLRHGTAARHREAERTGIIADLLHRRAGRAAYALLLRNLQPVYSALEAAVARHANAPLVRAFADPALARSAALASDLAALDGAGRAVLPEAETYAARIAAAPPLELAAHAYVRYFGDLSGGQILARLLGSSLELPPTALTVYAFPALNPEDAKSAMRAVLDTDGATLDDPHTVVAEAVVAFELTIALSNAVQKAASQR